MVKLLIVVGLPGSGKSVFINKVKGSYSGLIAEDFHAGAYYGSPRVTDSKYYSGLITALKANKDSIIADIEFCDSWRRFEVEHVIRIDAGSVDIDWHFFENNPEQCKQNAKERNRYCMQEELIKIDYLARKYFIPGECEQHKIYDGRTTHT